MTRVLLGAIVLTISLFPNRPAAAANPEWGSLSGSFVFVGDAEKPEPLKITKDNECCDKYQDEIFDQSLLLGDNKELTNVFVWLRTSRRGPKVSIHPDYEKAAAEDVLIDNTHCMFYPHAAGVWAGKQTLLVKNSDPIAQAAKIDTLINAPLNATIPIGGEVTHKFEKGEPLPLPVLCGVHPWESAQLLIHSNPYYAVSGKDGKFMIKNLPVGEWEFQFWHEKSGYLEAKDGWRRGRAKIEIKPGDNDLGTIECAQALFEKD